MRYRSVCHDCGSPATTVHSRAHRRHVRDLNLAEAQVWLDVEYRKIWCSTCGGVRVEHFDFADASSRVTHRLPRYVHDLCKRMTVQDVADHLELNPKTVKAIDKAFLEKSFGQTDGHGLRVLAIDEIALRKGHNYMTVVMDYFTGQIVWMGVLSASLHDMDSRGWYGMHRQEYAIMETTYRESIKIECTGPAGPRSAAL